MKSLLHRVHMSCFPMGSVRMDHCSFYCVLEVNCISRAKAQNPQQLRPRQMYQLTFSML